MCGMLLDLISPNTLLAAQEYVECDEEILGVRICSHRVELCYCVCTVQGLRVGGACYVL